VQHPESADCARSEVQPALHGRAFFKDEATADATLCALRDKVSVELWNECPRMQTEVVIETKDGRVLRTQYDSSLPGKDLQVQAQRLQAKFERLAEPVLGREGSARLLRVLERLEESRVGDLMAACAKA
jgi:hypothetical protein